MGPVPPPANPRPGSASRHGGGSQTLKPMKGAPAELGDLRGGSRSPSPSPLGNSHSMTSIGPGVSPAGGRSKLGRDMSDDALGSSNRARSPAALGPLGGSRAPSPTPPPHQPMTSIGPGFDGRGRSPSPAPPPLNRPGSAHSGGQRQLTADSIGPVQKSDKKEKKDKKDKKHKKDKHAEDDGGSSDR